MTGPTSGGPRAGRYRAGLLERMGSDGYDALRALAWSLPLIVPVLFATVWQMLARGHSFPVAVAVGLALGLASVLVAATVAFSLSRLAGIGFGRSLLPSGSSTPRVEEYSLAMSRVARGDLAGGIALLEHRVAERPDEAQARVALAELYALKAGDPGRARRHLEAVLAANDAPARERRYAASRLVDLYRGPLSTHPGAARRLREIDRLHPGLVPPGDISEDR